MTRWLALTLVCMFGLQVALADAGIDELVERGAARYADGLEVIRTDPVLARSLFAEAAAAFERAAEQSGVLHAELERAIGNAHMLAGETGRAVLAFRRALLADPSNRRAADGLRLARASLAVEVPETNGRRVLEVINMWPRYVAPWIMKLIFALSWACLWLGLLIARWRGRHAATGTLASLAILAAASGVALAAGVWESSHDRDVVVITTTDGYNGPSSDVYPPTFDQPVPAGTEAILVETRRQWSQIELRNGTRTWVRHDAVEPVRPGGMR
ncbi:MAG: hypothetical protein Kow0022_13720 [Phycisphaerales bacterium]